MSPFIIGSFLRAPRTGRIPNVLSPFPSGVDPELAPVRLAVPMWLLYVHVGPHAW